MCVHYVRRDVSNVQLGESSFRAGLLLCVGTWEGLHGAMCITGHLGDI